MPRLFAALPMDAGVRAALAARLAAVQSGPVGSVSGVRWTEPDQWHLTLAFYGEVGDDVAGRLAERLSRVAARTPPPLLCLGAGGTFGSATRGQVLTVAVTDEARTDEAAGDRSADMLTRLAERCRAAGRREGLAQPSRPYRPHVTVARGRPGSDLRPLAATLDAPPAVIWCPAELLLVRSRLGAGPGGQPEHVAVGRWPLGGRG